MPYKINQLPWKTETDLLDHVTATIARNANYHLLYKRTKKLNRRYKQKGTTEIYQEFLHPYTNADILWLDAVRVNSTEQLVLLAQAYFPPDFDSELLTLIGITKFLLNQLDEISSTEAFPIIAGGQYSTDSHNGTRSPFIGAEQKCHKPFSDSIYYFHRATLGTLAFIPTITDVFFSALDNDLEVDTDLDEISHIDVWGNTYDYATPQSSLSEGIHHSNDGEYLWSGISQLPWFPAEWLPTPTGTNSPKVAIQLNHFWWWDEDGDERNDTEWRLISTGDYPTNTAWYPCDNPEGPEEGIHFTFLIDMLKRKDALKVTDDYPQLTHSFSRNGKPTRNFFRNAFQSRTTHGTPFAPIVMNPNIVDLMSIRPFHLQTEDTVDTSTPNDELTKFLTEKLDIAPEFHASITEGIESRTLSPTVIQYKRRKVAQEHFLNLTYTPLHTFPGINGGRSIVWNLGAAIRGNIRTICNNIRAIRIKDYCPWDSIGQRVTSEISSVIYWELDPCHLSDHTPHTEDDHKLLRDEFFRYVNYAGLTTVNFRDQPHSVQWVCEHRTERDEGHHLFPSTGGQDASYIIDNLRDKYGKLKNYTKKVPDMYPGHRRLASEKGQALTTYGVELEVTSNQTPLDIFDATTQMFFAMKSDASIRGNGRNKFEIVTRPGTRKWQKAMWHQFFNDHTEGFSCNLDTDPNGIHIHVNNGTFADKGHLKRFIWFFHAPHNLQLISALSGRSSLEALNNYSSPTAGIRASLIDTNPNYLGTSNAYNKKPMGQMMKDAYNHHQEGTNRNNMSNPAISIRAETTEVRIFQGDATYQGVENALNVVDSVIEFTRNHGLQGCCAEGYAEFIEQNARKYKGILELMCSIAVPVFNSILSEYASFDRKSSEDIAILNQYIKLMGDDIDIRNYNSDYLSQFRIQDGQLGDLQRVMSQVARYQMPQTAAI